MATRKDDTSLWIWFCLQVTFIIFLVTMIVTNPAEVDPHAKGADVENPAAESKQSQ